MKKNELITSLKAHVADITETVQQNFLHLTDDNLNWKEGPSRWSILECCEHLNRYNNYYIPAIKSAIRSADGSHDQVISSTWIGKKSISMMHPDNRKKQLTFKKMNPANSALNRDVLNTFLREQSELLTLLNEAEAINVNEKKVPVEFFRLLKMTIAEGLEFIVVHEQRHIDQAKRIIPALSSLKAPVLSV